MLKPVPWANALTAITVIFYLVLWVLGQIAPDLFALVFNAQFLGADLASQVPTGQDIGAFLTTLIVLAVSVWVMGYVWATLYNKFQK